MLSCSASPVSRSWWSIASAVGGTVDNSTHHCTRCPHDLRLGWATRTRRRPGFRGGLEAPQPPPGSWTLWRATALNRPLMKEQMRPSIGGRIYRRADEGRISSAGLRFDPRFNLRLYLFMDRAPLLRADCSFGGGLVRTPSPIFDVLRFNDVRFVVFGTGQSL